MSHTITGLLRKPTFIKPGCGQDGQSTMFVIELSELVKDYQTQEKSYTNYKAMIFAKSPGQVDYYNKALGEGSFVVVSCDKLKLESREHNGKVYNTMMMITPRLDDAKFDDNAQPTQQAPAQQQQLQQPQQYQQAQPQQQQQQYQQAPQQGYNNQRG